MSFRHHHHSCSAGFHSNSFTAIDHPESMPKERRNSSKRQTEAEAYADMPPLASILDDDKDKTKKKTKLEKKGSSRSLSRIEKSKKRSNPIKRQASLPSLHASTRHASPSPDGEERLEKAKSKIQSMFMDQRKKEKEARLAKERTEQNAKSKDGDERKRRKLAFEQYKAYGVPDRETMKKLLDEEIQEKGIGAVAITPNDVDLLPWCEEGLSVNIPEMKKKKSDGSSKKKSKKHSTKKKDDPSSKSKKSKSSSKRQSSKGESVRSSSQPRLRSSSMKSSESDEPVKRRSSSQPRLRRNESKGQSKKLTMSPSRSKSPRPRLDKKRRSSSKLSASTSSLVTASTSAESVSGHTDDTSVSELHIYQDGHLE